MPFEAHCYSEMLYRARSVVRLPAKSLQHEIAQSLCSEGFWFCSTIRQTKGELAPLCETALTRGGAALSPPLFHKLVFYGL